VNETTDRRTAPRRSPRAGIAVIVLATVLALGGPAVAGLRGQMLDLTNQSRRARGLHALHIDRGIARDAKHHSARMARRGSLFHTPNVTRYLHNRHWSWWGENVGYSYSSDLGSLQRAFMRSAPHRHNILNAAYHRVGIGVERREDRVWVTLVFYG
jgi:uncharacterized protein YkwD